MKNLSFNDVYEVVSENMSCLGAEDIENLAQDIAIALEEKGDDDESSNI